MHTYIHIVASPITDINEEIKCRKLQEGLISDELSKEFFEADDAYRWELKDKKQDRSKYWAILQ